MSPTPHGEAARRVAERLSHVAEQNRGPEVTLRFNMAHVSTLLEEHGEMVQLLRECLHFKSVGFTRIHVHAFLRKLDGSPEPEAEPKPLYFSEVIALRERNRERMYAENDPGGAFPRSTYCNGCGAGTDFLRDPGSGCNCGGTYRVPVPDPVPEPAKLPAAPKVEVGDRKARRERFMCAIIASDTGHEITTEQAARWAEECIDASDALDAGEERHDR